MQLNDDQLRLASTIVVSTLTLSRENSAKIEEEDENHLNDVSEKNFAALKTWGKV